jgi:hypothetical protein
MQTTVKNRLMSMSSIWGQASRVHIKNHFHSLRRRRI